MDSEPLHAHSPTEVQLYLMATQCEKCGRGPLRSDARPPLPTSRRFSLTVRCGACDEAHRFTFTLPEDAPAHDRDDLYPVINRTNSTSEILDVGQWLVLFRIILEAAGKEKDKIEARRLGYEAAQCLEEAIKFYEDDDLPPEGALRCESTRQRRREQPQQFSKQHLLDMQAKLPKTSPMQRQGVTGSLPASGHGRTSRPRHPRRESAGNRPWWKFWKS